MAQASSRLSARSWYALAIGGAVAITAAGMAMTRLTHQTQALWVSNFLALVWGLVCADRAWRRVDETAREAQKSAWFWGGTFGLLLALIVAMTMPLFRQTWHALFLAIDAHRGGWPLHALTFVCGIMFAALMQIAGALLAWAVWWSARR